MSLIANKVKSNIREMEGLLTKVISYAHLTNRSVNDPEVVAGALRDYGDDKPETVRHRLEVYHASTEVLKDFYAKLGRLRTVNGSQSIEGANEDILKAIGAKV